MTSIGASPKQKRWNFTMNFADFGQASQRFTLIFVRRKSNIISVYYYTSEDSDK